MNLVYNVHSCTEMGIYTYSIQTLHRVSIIIIVTDAWQSLQQFPGVGGKVADCVCLMGLGHMTAVPVDVHVCRLALRDYASTLPPHLANIKSLSTANYKIIGKPVP